jgi:hypothetical protein
MVDGLRRNGQDGERGKHGKERHEEEDRALRQDPSDEAGERRDGDVAGVVEGGIAPHASRQLLPCNEAEREGSNCRAEDVTDHSEEAVGDQNRPEVRPERDDGCAGREHGKGGHDQTALGAGRIDQSAGRRLQG